MKKLIAIQKVFKELRELTPEQFREVLDQHDGSWLAPAFVDHERAHLESENDRLQNHISKMEEINSTLESENARLREAVRVMRDALKYQRRAWQWYVTGCQSVIDTGEIVELGAHKRTIEMAGKHKQSASDTISQVDALLKSEGEKE